MTVNWFQFSLRLIQVFHCWIHVCYIQLCCSIWNQVGFIFLNGWIGSSRHLRCSHCHRSTPWGLVCIFGAKNPKGWKLLTKTSHLQKINWHLGLLTSKIQSCMIGIQKSAGWFAGTKQTKDCFVWLHISRLNVLTSLLNWIVAKTRHMCFFNTSSQKPLNFLQHIDFMSWKKEKKIYWILTFKRKRKSMFFLIQ